MLVSALALSSGYLNVAAPGSRLAQSRVSSVNMDLQYAPRPRSMACHRPVPVEGSSRFVSAALYGRLACV